MKLLLLFLIWVDSYYYYLQLLLLLSPLQLIFQTFWDAFNFWMVRLIFLQLDYSFLSFVLRVRAELWRVWNWIFVSCSHIAPLWPIISSFIVIDYSVKIERMNEWMKSLWKIRFLQYAHCYGLNYYFIFSSLVFF